MSILKVADKTKPNIVFCITIATKHCWHLDCGNTQKEDVDSNFHRIGFHGLVKRRYDQGVGSEIVSSSSKCLEQLASANSDSLIVANEYLEKAVADFVHECSQDRKSDGIFNRCKRTDHFRISMKMHIGPYEFTCLFNCILFFRVLAYSIKEVYINSEHVVRRNVSIAIVSIKKEMLRESTEEYMRFTRLHKSLLYKEKPRSLKPVWYWNTSVFSDCTTERLMPRETICIQSWPPMSAIVEYTCPTFYTIPILNTWDFAVKCQQLSVKIEVLIINSSTILRIKALSNDSECYLKCIRRVRAKNTYDNFLLFMLPKAPRLHSSFVSSIESCLNLTHNSSVYEYEERFKNVLMIVKSEYADVPCVERRVHCAWVRTTLPDIVHDPRERVDTGNQSKDIAIVTALTHANHIIALTERVLQRAMSHPAMSHCAESKKQQVIAHIQSHFSSLRMSSIRMLNSEGIEVECRHCNQRQFQMPYVMENNEKTLAHFFGIM